MNYKSILVSLAEKTGDEPVDVTLKDLGVRITCQEYEAGAFAVSGDTVIFSSYKDQRLYKQTVDGQGMARLREDVSENYPSSSSSSGIAQTSQSQEGFESGIMKQASGFRDLAGKLRFTGDGEDDENSNYGN
ncbi:hypothetical protein LINPERHAP1_LOCUS32859 [Linum perenne]